MNIYSAVVNLNISFYQHPSLPWMPMLHNNSEQPFTNTPAHPVAHLTFPAWRSFTVNVTKTFYRLFLHFFPSFTLHTWNICRLSLYGLDFASLHLGYRNT
jgi:hypothetical protein